CGTTWVSTCTATTDRRKGRHSSGGKPLPGRRGARRPGNAGRPCPDSLRRRHPACAGPAHEVPGLERQPPLPFAVALVAAFAGTRAFDLAVVPTVPSTIRSRLLSTVFRPIPRTSASCSALRNGPFSL